MVNANMLFVDGGNDAVLFAIPQMELQQMVYSNKSSWMQVYD